VILCVCANISIDTIVEFSGFKPGEVNRVINEKRFPGGKGVHVAMAAAELGEEVTLLGFWSRENSRWMRDFCSSMNIRCIGPEVDAPNRTCFTFKCPGAPELDETEILGQGPEINAAEQAQFLDDFIKAARSASVITISGSLPKGIPDDFYAKMIASAKQNSDAKMIVDFTGKPLALALAEKPYAIHLNHHESLALTGETDSLAAAEKLITENHVTMAAITAGKEGVTLVCDGEAYRSFSKVNFVLTSVGCGDCLTAGLAVGISRKISLLDLANLASACGAANCIREELGMLYRSDVEKLTKQSQWEKLK